MALPFGRIQFAAPRQAVDVDTQRVLAQALFGARVCRTVESTAFQRSVPAGAPLTNRCSVQRTLKDVSLARTTLVICTVTDSLADASEWIIGAGVVAEHGRAPVGGVVVGIEPVLLHTTMGSMDSERTRLTKRARWC